MTNYDLLLEYFLDKNLNLSAKARYYFTNGDYGKLINDCKGVLQLNHGGVIKINSTLISDCIEHFNEILNNKSPLEFDHSISYDDELGYIVSYSKYVIYSDEYLTQKSKDLASKFARFLDDDYHNPNYEGAVKARKFIAEIKASKKLL